MQYLIEDVKNKGLGVTSLRILQPGETIIIDKPYVATILELDATNCVLACSHCVRPIEIEVHNELNYDLYGELACGAMFCCDECFKKGHFCPCASSAHASVVSDPLWQSTRFRLFCIVLAHHVASSANSDLLLFLNSLVAPPLRTASELASSEVQKAFLSYTQNAISSLRVALGVDADRTSPLSELVTPEGYARFWRICGGNLQSIVHPAVLSLLSETEQNQINKSLNIEQLFSSVPVDMLVTPTVGTGLFAVLCRINHSCDPNAEFKAVHSATDGPAEVAAVATRTILPGQEICVNYLDTNGVTKTPCSELLERYGFNCKCVVEMSNEINNL